MAGQMECDTIEKFGSAMRTLRRKRGLTQKDLAFSMGTTRKLISDMEKGKRSVSLRTALLAAREAGMDIIGKPR